MQLKALLLDLDGTLVNTAPDMVGTLNRVLVNHDCPTVKVEDAGLLVSNGAKALLEFGFADRIDEFQLPELIQEFLSDYAEHVSDESYLYDGMLETLKLCEQNQVRWGVVTNKPLELARGVMQGLGLLDRCAILLGGDSLPVKKPDPVPLLHCCLVLELAASECIYVGDHQRDIEAGRAAGMDTAAALWGYITPDQDPEQWQARYLINEPHGLNKLVKEKLLTKDDS